MSDDQEKSKQKVAIELEHAILYGTFILPLIALVIILIFTEEYYKHFPAIRYLLSCVAFLALISVNFIGE